MALSGSAKDDRSARLRKAACGVAAVGLLAGVACQLPCSAETAPLFVVLLLLSFASFWLTCRFFIGHNDDSAQEARFIFCSALAVRLLVLPSEPSFDDDLHRYRWDGRVLAAGINPYRDSPDADAVRFLRDADYEHIAYAYVPTIYPPLSQALFWCAHQLRPAGLLGFKLLALTFDLLTLVLLFRLLKDLGLPLNRACLYAWHPLLLKEFSNSGHQDSAGIFLLLLFVALAVRGKAIPSAIALSLSALTKLFPISLLPLTRGRFTLRHGILAIAIMLAAYGPFVASGVDPFAGLRVYAEYWEFNGGLFLLVRRLLAWGFSNPDAWARRLVALLYAAALVAGSVGLKPGVSPDRNRRFVAATGAVLTAGVLLSPTVDPWYVCWLAPFVCLASCPGAFLLTGTVLLSYVYYAGHVERAWVLALEYLPVYALLALQAYGALRGGPPRRSMPDLS